MERADFFFLLRLVRVFGRLPPSRRASESRIAIACFLLCTFFPERPDFSVPRFLSCIAFFTLEAAFLPYRAMGLSFCDHQTTFREKVALPSCNHIQNSCFE